jgi:anaerobic selenocysteine-containing dehydrogenase
MSEKGNGSKLSRRNFMKGLGAGSAAATLATTLPITARAAAPPHKAHYGMLIDTRRCIGCHACSVACKAEFDVPLASAASIASRPAPMTHAFPILLRGPRTNATSVCSVSPRA